MSGAAPTGLFEVEWRADGVVAIAARRPPVNAMAPELLLELERHVLEIGASEEARVVVFASAIPDYFMVGFDLTFIEERLARGLGQSDLEELRAIGAQVHRTTDAIEALPQPTIAAISGHAVGGGFELSLACDFRIMVDEPRYRIGLPEVLLGIIPAAGGTQRLPRLVRLPVALSILLEGRRLDAQEALRDGLVHELAPRDRFDAAVAAMAARLRQGGRLAQALVKACIRQGLRDPAAGYQQEETGFVECVASAEGQARIRAFLDKKNRSP